MNDFVESVTIDADEAIIDKINKAGSPFKFAETSEVATGDTVAGVTLVLSRPLADAERDTLRAAIISLGDSVEPGLIKDLDIAKGFKAWREFAGRAWKFTLSGHLRSDKIPAELPE